MLKYDEVQDSTKVIMKDSWMTTFGGQMIQAELDDISFPALLQ